MLHSSQTVLSRVWPGRVRGTLLDATEGIRCNNEAVLGCSHDAQMRYFRGEGKANRHSGRRGEGRHGKGGGSKEEAPAQESRLFDLMSNPQNLTKKREAVLRETAATFIDTSKLPFLKYLMPEKDYQRFVSGSCTTEERKKALRKYENVLPRRPHQMHMIQRNRKFIDSYSLRGCMVPEVRKTPEEQLDSMKEKICALYSIEESEFEKYKQGALKIIESRRNNVASEEEKEWEQVFSKMKENPALSAKAACLKNNPDLSNKDRLEIATTIMRCVS